MLSDDLDNQRSNLSNCCEYCGIPHLYSWECKYDLHGEGDCFKTSCAVCETEIPSNAPRKADRFGNLYCSADCALAGQDMLLETSTQSADTDAVTPELNG